MLLNSIKTRMIATLLFMAILIIQAKAQTIPEIGLHRIFERSINNSNTYSNKFTGVNLKCAYTSPSGKVIDFDGFFDGDGLGNGNSTTGTVWKIRFFPNETGVWKYTWLWSDGTVGGVDSFLCVTTGAGKGMLQPYKNNPRWLAYNGTEPVWIKSYYESAQGSISQPIDWVTKNVYQPMIDRGYNHFMVNFLLPLCCFGSYYTDGPAQTTQDLYLYQSGKASTTMRMDVWKLIENHMGWLNDRNIGIHMFLGFDGSKNSGPSWANLSDTEKDFYVKYVVARLAPFANLAGWNFLYEVDGSRLTHELGWAQLVQKYDVFNHLRTYQDENPGINEYKRPEYNFATIENHLMYSPDKNIDRPYWKDAWTHHAACLAAYVPGKPVYMVEGNALWRRYWFLKLKNSYGIIVTKDDVRQSAWGCVTAGASFNWCGHSSNPLMISGPEGYPFFGDVNEYASSALQIDILSNVMKNEVIFYNMIPSDSLLSGHNAKKVWCLSDSGQQYLVFTIKGSPFNLQLEAGQYNSTQWINAKTGSGRPLSPITVTHKQSINFIAPDTTTDWVLLVRKEWQQKILTETEIISAETDSSTGFKVYVKCNKEMNIPANYVHGFKVMNDTANYSIKNISVDNTNKNLIVIELNKAISGGKTMVLSYLGTLTSTDSCFLSPVENLSIKNNLEITHFDKISGVKCTIYPNPVTNQLYIKCNKKINAIKISDLSGGIFYKQENLDVSDTQISMSNIPNRLYLLTLKLNNLIITEKILKK